MPPLRASLPATARSHEVGTPGPGAPTTCSARWARSGSCLRAPIASSRPAASSSGSWTASGTALRGIASGGRVLGGPMRPGTAPTRRVWSSSPHRWPARQDGTAGGRDGQDPSASHGSRSGGSLSRPGFIGGYDALASGLIIVWSCPISQSFSYSAGGIFPQAEWSLSLLYQDTHSAVATVTSPASCHGPSRLISSFLYREFTASAAALS